MDVWKVGDPQADDVVADPVPDVGFLRPVVLPTKDPSLLKLTGNAIAKEFERKK